MTDGDGTLSAANGTASEKSGAVVREACVEHTFVQVGKKEGTGRVQLCTKCGTVRIEHFSSPYPEA